MICESQAMGLTKMQSSDPGEGGMRRIVVDIAEAILPQSILMSIRVRRGLRGGRDPELRILPVLARGGAFVDVGANIGTWTGPAARSFRQVHAFEPDALIATTLQKAVPGNVTVHSIALSDHAGVGTFRVPIYRGRAVRTRSSLEADVNPGCDEIISEVRLSPLDELDLRGIDVLKIDVEGHEAGVLRGSVKTLARERPTLIVEIEDRHNAGKSEDIIRGLVECGYSCYYIYQDRLMEFQAGSISELQAKENVPVSGATDKSAAYINNFVFIPLERGNERDLIDQTLERAVKGT